MAGKLCFFCLNLKRTALLSGNTNYFLSKYCRVIQKPLQQYCTKITFEAGNEARNTALRTASDPGPFFVKEPVQQILKRLTGIDLEKVYKIKPGLKRTPPRYEFMTEIQLQEVMEETKNRALTKLQMPPVMKAREPITGVLSNDPELIGYTTSKLLFVDISYGLKDRTRSIVARDTDGILRKASWEEREKLNKIFFPVNKRKFHCPRMFQDDNLLKILDSEEYEFVLDHACLQFEPDDPFFIKICHRTYDHIDKQRKYDILHSTRHYGPMAFYYAFYASIDNLLLHLMQKNRLDEAADLVQLFCLVRPDSKTAKSELGNSHLSTIKTYMRSDSTNPNALELVVQTCEEIQLRQQEYLKDIKEAHGQM